MIYNIKNMNLPNAIQMNDASSSDCTIILYFFNLDQSVKILNGHYARDLKPKIGRILELLSVFCHACDGMLQCKTMQLQCLFSIVLQQHAMDC